ncbi:RHS repeat protein [Cohnella faecalis]|uniref:RHS repeat protein n=2 Tax=Cohnella faecalis TaxID=2315694 RepID=A0A398CUP0_9BACL|nr:RHS repeat protein [Cohnella faecalis]
MNFFIENYKNEENESGMKKRLSAIVLSFAIMLSSFQIADAEQTVPEAVASQTNSVRSEVQNGTVNNDESGINSVFSDQQLKSIKERFTSEMRLLSAYYYPELVSSLSQEELTIFLSLDDAKLKKMYLQLSQDQQANLERLVPLVKQYLVPQVSKNIQSEATERSLNGNSKASTSINATAAAASTEYSYSPKDAGFNYQQSFEGDVDPVSKSFNQSDIDLFLKGDVGLDIVLERSYNSSSSFFSRPVVSCCDSNQPYDFVQDADLNNTTSAQPASYGVNEIAPGWELNIPIMTIGYFDKYGIYKKETNNSKYEFTTFYGYNVGYSRFQLDDGNTYTFASSTLLNSTYKNVTYSETKDDYVITVDDNVSYYFDRATMRIKMKRNKKGNFVTYTFKNYPSTSTLEKLTIDPLGQPFYVDILLSGKKVSGFQVFDRTNTLIKHVKYNVPRTTTTTPLTIRKLTRETTIAAGLAYYQLESVVDVLQNKTLKAYTYYNPTQTLADFNLEDDWKYFIDQNGNYILDVKDRNGNGVESAEVVRLNKGYYGEVAYLLLKEITDYTGFKTTVQYSTYDRSWPQYTDYEESEQKRGTIRSYGDLNLLQYIGYLPVVNVFYSYTDANGQTKIYTNNYQRDYSRAQEIWNRPKSVTPATTYLPAHRLVNASSYRNGDIQSSSMTQIYEGFSTSAKREFRVTSKGTFKLLWEKQINQLPQNNLNVTDGSNNISYSTENITAYQYDEGTNKPYLIKSLNGGQGNLVNDFGRSLPGNIANFANIQKLEYNDYGDVIYKEDTLGNKMTAQYDGIKHQVSYQSIVSADGKSKTENTFEYNTDSTIKKITTKQTYNDPATQLPVVKSSTEEYVSYNVRKMPTQVIVTADGSTQVINYLYDTRGFLVIKETVSVKLSDGTLKTEVSNSYTYDSLNRVTSQTYPDGSKVVYTYDSLNRKLSESFIPSTGGGTRTIQYTYDDSNRTITKILPDGEKIISTYTPYGTEEKIQRAIGSNTKVIQTKIFDSTGMVVKATLPYNDPTKGEYYSYGEDGQIQTVTNALGQSSNYYYSNSVTATDGSLSLPQMTSKTVDQDGKETWSYADRAGRVVKQVEKSGSKTRTTLQDYNGAGQVTKRQVISNGQLQTTWFEYDAVGNLIYVRDEKGQQYKYTYNSSNQLESISINGVLQNQKQYNELGWLLKSTNANGQAKNYQYRTNGLVEKVIDEEGQISNYSYTPYNEQERLSVKNATGTELYWLQNTFDPTSRLVTGITNSENETLTYRYDSWKHLDQQTVAGKKYSFAYDAFDRLSTVVYPDNAAVNYSYDALNRISTVSYPDMGVVSYGYNVSQNANKYTVTYPNGLVQEKLIDGFDELVSVTHSRSSSAPEWTESFGFDSFGNIETINRNGQIFNYLYDGLNRISTDVSSQKEYHYDDRGNIQSFEQNGQTYSFAYDNSNRLTQAALPSNTINFTYDNRGNRLTANSDTYTYNSLDQLKTFTNGTNQALYTYYGDGLRATKKVNGVLTRFVYLNGRVIDELDSNGNSKARNIWGNELIFRKDNATNQKGYYSYNGHGDVVRITDAAGTAINSYDYDIWGISQAKRKGCPTFQIYRRDPG